MFARNQTSGWKRSSKIRAAGLILFTTYLFCLCTSAYAQTSREAEPADSLRTYNFGEVLIVAPTPGLIAEPGSTEIPSQVLDEQDSGAADAIAPLVPAARVGTNSRGEANMTIRGSSERQVAIFQDGVRLNIPWDERVDLSLVPTDAVGKVHVTRGFGSVLDGPNTLGGVVHFVTRALPEDGSHSRVHFLMGEAGRIRGGITLESRKKKWSWVGSLEHRGRDAFLLPEGFEASHNQPGSRSRLNSDLSQTSLFFRVARHLSRDGAIGFSIRGMESDKGVPPETHLGGAPPDSNDVDPLPSARHWRIPAWRRAMLSLQGDFVPDEERKWAVDGSLSVDFFGQDTQEYVDSTYTGTPEELAAALDEARDVTRAARFRITRSNDRHRTRNLAVSGSIRLTDHKEMEGGGPEEEFAQNLYGAAVEWSGELNPEWLLRVGGGYDGSSTPKTGDRGSQPDDHAPTVGLRVTRVLSEAAQLHFSAGQRARFPSLRERYSDAGGTFDPNEDLDPEVQSSFEFGGGWSNHDYQLSGGTYANFLDDGIVRVALDDGTRRRVNEAEIRTFGFEMGAQAKIGGSWVIDGNYALIHTRAKDAAGEFTKHVERRPSYTTYLGAGGPIPRAFGLELKAEAELTGSVYSLDVTAGELIELDPTQRVNLRLAYRITPVAGRRFGGSIFLRLDNVLDQEIFSQVGLPDPGRVLTVGLRMER